MKRRSFLGFFTALPLIGIATSAPPATPAPPAPEDGEIKILKICCGIGTDDLGLYQDIQDHHWRGGYLIKVGNRRRERIIGIQK